MIDLLSEHILFGLKQWEKLFISLRKWSLCVAQRPANFQDQLGLLGKEVPR